jgi:UDP-2-acetamido-2-deoxy-ribo-hexuluronate aminotransferase
MRNVTDTINFFDVKSQLVRVRDRVEQRFSAILDHGAFINGPEVDEMERRLARFAGAADCVAVGSGTQAIVMPLMAWGVGQGDAVFIPTLTYNATANAVLLSGATPVFVDIDPKTFNIDPVDLERRIADVRAGGRLKPKAIIGVDLYGLPADYRLLTAIAEREGIHLMSDAAQSFGGKLDGKWVGALAPVTATSFYPTKSLGCFGDGGAIFVEDPVVADILRSIRWHGTGSDRKESIRVGINGRLDSMQCAVVTEKMEIFESELARKTLIAGIYDKRIRPHADAYTPPAGATSGHGLYTVAIDNREAVSAAMKVEGVPTAMHYYLQPLHEMTAFRDYAPEGGLPMAERITKRLLCLPMHAYVTDEQADRVCAAFERAIGA